MSLSNKQRKKLESALLNAFPEKASLERMVSHGLGKNLNEIASDGNLQDITFKLIKKAEAEGWIEDLIIAAVESNSTNLSLQTIAQELSSPSVVRLAQIDNQLLNRKFSQFKVILTNLAVLSIGIGIGIIIWEYTHYQDTVKDTVKDTLKDPLKGEIIQQNEMRDLCNNEKYYKPILSKKFGKNVNHIQSGGTLMYDNSLKEVIPAYRWRCVYQIKPNSNLEQGGSERISIGLMMDEFICKTKYGRKNYNKSAYLHYNNQNPFYCIYTPPDK